MQKTVAGIEVRFRKAKGGQFGILPFSVHVLNFFKRKYGRLTDKTPTEVQRKYKANIIQNNSHVVKES